LCPDWHLTVNEALPTLGIPTGPYLKHVTDEGLEHFEATQHLLVQAGCTIIEVSTMADFEDIIARHQLILAAEAAQVHASWFAEFGQLYHPKTAELIQAGRAISVGNLAEALTGRQLLRRQLTSLMDDFQLDLWIAPSAPGAAPKGLDSTGDPILNLPWTHSGLPVLSLPSGANSKGLPMGLQIVGRWYEDERLVDWSVELESILAG
jgi:Asp-tRNA(Asn)/Glu-tRNA(Gln) amidotransferase A subunit family amidase